MRMMDAEFGSTTFVVVDVELRSQLGGPVPAAVAALALSGADWQPLWRVHREIHEERTLSSETPRPPRLPHELLAAAIAESLHFVLPKPLLTRYSSMELNLYVTIPGTLMMLPFAGDLTHQLASATTPNLLVLVYLGIFPAAVAYLLWNYALARLDVSASTSGLYALPLITILISFAFLHE